MQTPPIASSPENASVLGPDFFWGFATAAAQVEGAWDADGKGESIWDKFCRLPGKVIDKSTNADATRAYDLYKEDVQLLKKLGVNSYRFSLAWSRIIPLGGKDDPVNEAGLAYYSNLVDELLANNITPFVTLFHWDTPQALEDRYGGMLNQTRYTLDFERYARVCFAALGDRVKHWITYNEPGVYTLAGYAAGVHAPGRSSLPERNDPGDSSTEPFIVAHTQLVSHARAVKIYRDEFKPTQKGVIGITLHGNYSAPWDEHDPKDVEAAERARQFEIAWFADPVYGSGDYPPCMREQLGDRLPHFTPAEKALVHGSSDFYGMNSKVCTFSIHDMPMTNSITRLHHLLRPPPRRTRRHQRPQRQHHLPRHEQSRPLTRLRKRHPLAPQQPRRLPRPARLDLVTLPRTHLHNRKRDHRKGRTRLGSFFPDTAGRRVPPRVF